MRRESDTGIVRNYCQNHEGGVFDLNYLSKHVFKDIPNVNLRKIVTRFIDQGILRQVSKGVYLIGESNIADEDRIIKHYIKDDWGIPTGKYLLYTLGLADEEPMEKIIKANHTIGTRNICNIKVIESHSSFFEIVGAKKIITALEILSASNEINEDKLLKATELVEELLRGYTDGAMTCYVKDEYPRNVYLRLAGILDSMQISHKVIENCVSKKQI